MIRTRGVHEGILKGAFWHVGAALLQPPKYPCRQSGRFNLVGIYTMKTPGSRNAYVFLFLGETRLALPWRRPSCGRRGAKDTSDSVAAGVHVRLLRVHPAAAGRDRGRRRTIQLD